MGKPEDARPLRFGLPDDVLTRIVKVFAAHSAAESVLIYGSRAMGNYRGGSDIDLTVIGDSLSSKELAAIELELDDLLLPWKIDLSLFRMIGNPDLRDHIHRVGKPLHPPLSHDDRH